MIQDFLAQRAFGLIGLLGQVGGFAFDHGSEAGEIPDEVLQGFAADFLLMLQTTGQDCYFLLHEGFERIESFREFGSERCSFPDEILFKGGEAPVVITDLCSEENVSNLFEIAVLCMVVGC